MEMDKLKHRRRRNREGEKERVREKYGKRYGGSNCCKRNVLTAIWPLAAKEPDYKHETFVRRSLRCLT